MVEFQIDIQESYVEKFRFKTMSHFKAIRTEPRVYLIIYHNSISFFSCFTMLLYYSVIFHLLRPIGKMSLRVCQK